jgi:hypothetical protein
LAVEESGSDLTPDALGTGGGNSSIAVFYENSQFLPPIFQILVLDFCPFFLKGVSNSLEI